MTIKRTENSNNIFEETKHFEQPQDIKSLSHIVTNIYYLGHSEAEPLVIERITHLNTEDLATLVASSSATAVFRTLKPLSITNERQYLDAVLKIFKTNLSDNLVKNLCDLTCNNPDNIDLFYEILLVCANKYPVELLQVFPSTNLSPQQRFEIAKVCAKQNPLTLSYLNKLNIPEFHNSILETCATHWFDEILEWRPNLSPEEGFQLNKDLILRIGQQFLFYPKCNKSYQQLEQRFQNFGIFTKEIDEHLELLAIITQDYVEKNSLKSNFYKDLLSSIDSMPSYVKLQIYSWIGPLLLHLEEQDPTKKNICILMLKALINLKSPTLRTQLAPYLMSLLKNDTVLEDLSNISCNEFNKQKLLFDLLLCYLKDSGINKEILNKLNDLIYPIFKGNTKIKSLLQLIYKIISNKGYYDYSEELYCDEENCIYIDGLTLEQKNIILKRLYEEPMALLKEAEHEYQNKLKKCEQDHSDSQACKKAKKSLRKQHRQQMIQLKAQVQDEIRLNVHYTLAVFNLKNEYALTNQSASEILEYSLRDLFCFDSEKSVLDQWYQAFLSNQRYAIGIFNYITYIKSVNSFSTPIFPDFVRYVKAVLENRYEQELLEAVGNTHITRLREIDPTAFSKWMEPIPDVIVTDEQTNETFTLSDSTNYLDRLLIGSEVPSCQSLEASSINSAGLISYLLDPKIRFVNLKTTHQHLIGRAKLSILFYGDRNFALLLEKPYHSSAKQQKNQALIEAIALKRAAHMGCPLFVAKGYGYEESPTPCVHNLFACNNGLSCEYVDSLKGLQGSGKYKIDAMNIALHPLSRLPE